MYLFPMGRLERKLKQKKLFEYVLCVPRDFEGRELKLYQLLLFEIVFVCVFMYVCVYVRCCMFVLLNLNCHQDLFGVLL